MVQYAQGVRHDCRAISVKILQEETLKKRFFIFAALAAAITYWFKYAATLKPTVRKPNLEAIESPEAASVYTRMTGLPHFKYLTSKVAERVTKWMPGGRALDVGSGPGRLAIEMAQKCRYLEVVAMDLSGEMAGWAKNNAREADVADRVTTAIGSSEQIPFPDSSFDLVVSTLSLHHWNDPVKALDEIARVVKPGGRYMIFDLRRDVPVPFWTAIYSLWRFAFPSPLRDAREPIGSIESAYTPEEVERLAEQSNLKDWRVTTGPIWVAIEGNIP